MEVELFVHGVPSGEGFWGKEDDRNYFGTFYDNSSDEVKFLIQTRALNNKPYCYYNYLVYKTVGSQNPNVVANDGRDGSYFGITLRFDAYCKDIVNMYRILDTVFHTYVMGDILKMEKSKLKYTTSDFANVSNVLDNIEKVTLQLIQNAFSIDSFTKLDGFALSGGNYPKYNLFDCTQDSALAAVKQYSKLAISPYYLSNKEAELQQKSTEQIQAVKQQCELRLKETEAAMAKEKNEISASLSSAKQQVTQLQKSLEQKEKELNQVKQDSNKYRTGGKIGGLGASTTPSMVSGSHLHSNATEQGFLVVKFMKSIAPIINTFLLLLLILILLNPFGGCLSASEKGTSYTIDSLNRENHRLKEKLIAVESAHPEVFSGGFGETGNNSKGAEENKLSLPKDFDINKVNIEIRDYNGEVLNLKGGVLNLYDYYEIVAQNGVKDGKWEGVGCHIIENSYDHKVTMIPEKETVKIIYHVGDKVKKIELKAKNAY